MQRIIERVVEACRPVPVTAKIRLGCTRDTINAIEVAQVVEAAGAVGLDRSWPDGGRLFQGLGRLGADFRDQAASEADSADRQRRSVSPEAVVEAFRRYAGRWRDDRPGGAVEALAVSPSARGPARASRFRPTRRSRKSGS